uniref:Single stranded DNA binding protein 2a n=1 Tax=Cyprinus carpio carpio TaxID=630221 RepID=A0A8C1HB68_CYPCA
MSQIYSGHHVDLSLNLYNASFVLCLTWQIRWEKNITLGEPPGFLHSWWCVFWDLYCAAPERRETCEHSSEAKAFHDYSAAATQSPVIGSPPGDGMPLPPGFFQQFMSPRYPGGPRGSLRIPNQALGPGNQMLLPSGMDPTRQPGPPSMSGPMQRMTPRGMVPIGPQNYGGGIRPPLNALVGPGMPGINMGPAGGRSWPNPPSNNSMPYSSASPGSYSVGNVKLSTVFCCCYSNNSSDNMYSLISSVPPNGNRPNFPLGSGPDGPIGSMASMEPHHMNGSLGKTDFTDTTQCQTYIHSPGNLSMNNQPGTPRDDGEMGANFLNPFQSESVCMQKAFSK